MSALSSSPTSAGAEALHNECSTPKTAPAFLSDRLRSVGCYRTVGAYNTDTGMWKQRINCHTAPIGHHDHEGQAECLWDAYEQAVSKAVETIEKR